LLMSPPDEMARCLTELMEETFIRAGDDRIDIERFIPQPGQPMQLIDPATGMVVPAFPAPMPGGMPGGGGGTMPMAAGGQPTSLHGDVVALADLPPQRM